MTRVTIERETQILRLIREACSVCDSPQERHLFLARIELYCWIRHWLEDEPQLFPIQLDIRQFKPPRDCIALNIAQEIADDAVANIGVHDLLGICNLYRDLPVVEFFGPAKETNSARADRLKARMLKNRKLSTLRFIDITKEGHKLVEYHDHLAQRALRQSEERRKREASHFSLKYDLGRLKKPLTWGQVFGAYAGTLAVSADKAARKDQVKALDQLLSPRRPCSDCGDSFDVDKRHPRRLLCPRCVNKRKQERHRTKRANERKTLEIRSEGRTVDTSSGQ